MNVKTFFIAAILSLVCFPLSILAEDWESIFHPNQKAYENFLKELEKRDISLDAFLNGNFIERKDLTYLLFGRYDEARLSMLQAIRFLHEAHTIMAETRQDYSLADGGVLWKPRFTLEQANSWQARSLDCFNHACQRYQYLEDYAMKYCPENVAAVRKEFEHYRYYINKYNGYLHNIVAPDLIRHCESQRALHDQKSMQNLINILNRSY
ncbi:MAG: hypothetical protein IJD43_15400 [Thermoguttaceae bacterium]|nr:hypothetical protein [Thermoguttaceae bacterium]